MAQIHHAQILVQNGNKYLQKFTRNANFRLFATRTSASLKQWAVRSGSIIFIITEVSQGTCAQMMETSPKQQKSGHLDAGEFSDVNPPGASYSLALPDQCFLEPAEVTVALWSDGCSREDHVKSRDTVFNVAFEVNNVEEALTRAEANGAKVLCRATVVKDSVDDGHVTIAAVQSCVGNIVHTLVNCSSYRGIFLPGFVPASNCVSDDSLTECSPSKPDKMQQNKNQLLPASLLSHIDHVTFACPMGSSSDVLQWYERCFGMKRFLLVREECEGDGFVVQGRNVGLRMKAMEYWHCAESGLALPANPEKEDEKRPRPPKPKFVIAEALPGHGPNQVETFLVQHGGAGIQHIGLHTDNILQAVSSLRQAGLSFIEPPATYYTEVGKLAEISRIRNDVKLLQKMGILLDEESPHPDNNKWMDKGKNKKQLMDGEMQSKYLMQVFTKPLFERDTFFLEIIQRHGATGFGAGNIQALWRAVQSYMSYDDL